MKFSMKQIQLDRDSPIPLYFQVATGLEQQIRDKVYAVGDRLPTEVDLVAAIGVSQMTVRQALDLLVQRRLVVREQGRGTFVRQNAIDQEQRPPRCGRIAAVMPWSASSIFHPVMVSIERVASRQGYHPILANSENDPQVEIRKLRELIAHGIDGLIWAAPSRDTNRAFVRKINAEGLSVVQVDRQVPGLAADFVGSNNIAAMKQIVDHLIACGAERIAYIEETGQRVSATYERREGLIAACQQLGLTEPVVFRSRSLARDNGRVCADKILTRRHSFDAVVTQIGAAAAGFTERALQRGVDVPGSMRVVGFDADYLDAPSPLPLTTVRQNFDRIGERAAELLLDRVEGMRSTSPIEERFPTELLVRQTTTPDARMAAS